MKDNLKFSINKNYSIYIYFPLINTYNHTQDYGKETVIDIEFNTNLFILNRANYFDFICRILGFGIRIIKYKESN